MTETIARLHHDFASGRNDPVRAAEEAIAAAERMEGVFISLRAEAALREAHASLQRWQEGCPLGPLDGTPFAFKDLFDIAGTVTTAGADLFRGAAPAAADAPSVAALKAAGVVSIGKTNLSEFAFSGLGINPHFGTPTQQDLFGRARIPGGSSSGSAMAVRQGVVPAAMGTDTAGSIRIPAALCGLVGYKPTSSRFSRDGVFPLASTFDSIGPIARTVEDCALIEAALRGADAFAPLPSLRGVSFVVESRVIADDAVEPAVRDNLFALMGRITKAGGAMTVRPVDAFRQAAETIAADGWAGSHEANRLHRERLAGPERARMDPRTAARLDRGALISEEKFTALLQRRAELQKALANDLAGDILVLPTVAHSAPELAPLEADAEHFAATNLATLRLTMIGSFLDMPGFAFPSGRDRLGLCTSVLFSAPAGQDDRLIAAMLAVETVLMPRAAGSTELTGK